jgi:amidase
MQELAWMDATAQAELVRRKEISSLELVDAAIARIEKLNPEINAVITPLFDKARAQAALPALPQGPFRGVPFLLKDMICHSAGDPYHAGMRLLRDLAWIAPHDTHLAARFREAGFVVLGKTNTPELGTIPSAECAAHGATRNPWDRARSAGGSSGGSAAAVAAGFVAAAHGNHGGGSIRIPASECGLVGLKPSRGRVSLGPDHGEVWAGLAVEHALTRSVRDSAAILDAIAGPMPGDPYNAPRPVRPFAAELGTDVGRLRIGVLRHAPAHSADTHPDCIEAVTAAARLLESLGHVVEESHPAALDDQEVMAPWTTVVSSCVAAEIDDWSRRLGRPVTNEDLEPQTWAMVEIGRIFSAREYLGALEWLRGHSRRIVEWWHDGFDLLLTPTLGEPPPPLGEFTASPDDPLGRASRQTPFVTFTSPFNITGQPAISLPLFWNTQGLPIGIQLVAAYGREDLLFRTAAQLEQAQPWAQRRPPL